MRDLMTSKGLALILSIVLLTIPMSPPSLYAYGPGASWQIGTAGTGTLFGSGFGFWGWCTFVGDTSGTAGDCQFSQYLHMSNGNVQCETHFDITGWDTGPGTMTPLTGQPDFFVTSGTITVHPAPATPACLAFLMGAGFNVVQTSSSTGEFVAPPTDLGTPAGAGHYSFNGQTIFPIDYTEFQIQVSKLP